MQTNQLKFTQDDLDAIDRAGQKLQNILVSCTQKGEDNGRVSDAIRAHYNLRQFIESVGVVKSKGRGIPRPGPVKSEKRAKAPLIAFFQKDELVVHNAYDEPRARFKMTELLTVSDALGRHMNPGKFFSTAKLARLLNEDNAVKALNKHEKRRALSVSRIQDMLRLIAENNPTGRILQVGLKGGYSVAQGIDFSKEAVKTFRKFSKKK